MFSRIVVLVGTIVVIAAAWTAATAAWSPAAAASPTDSSETFPGFPAVGILIADGARLLFYDPNSATTDVVVTDPTAATFVGIAVRPDGSVLLSSTGNDRIQRLDPTTRVLTTVSQGGLLTNPDGIALADDRLLYVADLETGSIVEIDLVTAAQRRVATSLGYVVWVAYDPSDGSVYASNVDQILRVDPVSGVVDVVVPAGSLPGVYGIAFGPDGALYAAGYYSQTVYRIDTSNGIAVGISAGVNLVSPMGITYGSDGFLYVTNYGTEVLVRIDPVSGTQTALPFAGQPESANFGVVTYPATGEPPPPPPPSPTNVVATDDDAHQIRITWDDTAEETEYVLLRGGNFLATVPADVTEFIDTPPVGTYEYCVSARVGFRSSLPDCDSGTRVPPRFAPLLEFVRDVPADQGGFVQLGWLRSEIDVVPGPNPVTGYRVWRRLPESFDAPAANADAGVDSRRDRVVTARVAAGGQLEYWEALVTLPAAGLEGYGYIAATPFDSLPDANRHTAFFVSALTADPSVFYDSEVVSGYSVDNLAPATPSGIAGRMLSGAGVRLRWDLSPDTDFDRFAVYRDTAESFVANAHSLIGTTRDTSFVDPNGSRHYYKVSAFDEHGNESGHALLRPLDISGASLLRGLAAVEVENGIEIRFEIASGSDVLRATIWRATEDDRRLASPLTPEPIEVAPGGFRYLDTTVRQASSYWYWVDLLGPSGLVASDGPAHGIRQSGAPGFTRFDSPAPNPSRAAVSLSFALAPDLVPAAGLPVHLRIFDAAGRLVRSIDAQTKPWGEHAVTWDGRDNAGRSVRAGMYRLVLEVGAMKKSWPVVRL